MSTRVNGRRVINAAAVAALGCVALSMNTAHADVFVPLPGGEISQALGDGTVVTLTLSDESATINPSLGGTPLHRNVWASGRGAVAVSSPTRVRTVKLYPGYVVSCQIDIGAPSPANNSGTPPSVVDSVAVPPISTVTTPPSSVGGRSESLVVGPGQAVTHYVLDVAPPDDEAHRFYHQVNGSHGSVTWVDETIAVNGCAGYAQARSFVSAEVETDSATGMVTLWGQPFSLD